MITKQFCMISLNTSLPPFYEAEEEGGGGHPINSFRVINSFFVFWIFQSF